MAVGFTGDIGFLPTPAGTGGSTPAIGGTLTSATAGSVIFAGSESFAQDNANLFWDDTNNSLGIGTATPFSGTSANFSIFPDSDRTMICGRVRIDSRTTDVAHISHFDQTAAQGGTLQLFTTGSVTLNAATGQTLRLAINGSSNVSMTSTTIGFLGTAAVVKQTSGANLTNNVTVGGTDDTIANYTDLSVYANDSAAIRNDIYQLARKLKQINDGLRTYGLFT